MSDMLYTGSPMSDPKSYLTPTQIAIIRKAIIDKRFKLLFYLLAMTGRRVSEVVRCLTPNDIDYTNNLINFTILKRKTPTKSLIAIRPKLINFLKKYVEENKIAPDRYIFPMSRQRVDQVLKKAAEKADLLEIGSGKHNKLHIHMLRHSFAIEGAKKAESPADIVQLKNMLGHARIDTTMFYLKFNPQEQRKLLEKMWKK